MIHQVLQCLIVPRGNAYSIQYNTTEHLQSITSPTYVYYISLIKMGENLNLLVCCSQMIWAQRMMNEGDNYGNPHARTRR